MALTKEAIAIVLDIGKSMHLGIEKPSVLEKAKQCINMIIQRKIFSESKDEIALIVFGSKDTANSLAENFDSGYENIKIVQNFQPASWELLEFVNDLVGTDLSTDFIRENSMLAACNLFQTTTGKKILSRRILFLSCFSANFCSDKVNTICEELNLNKIDLNIIGPVAYPTEECDESFLSKASKAEKCVSQILKQVNGESYSFSEALPALIYYQKKKIQAVPWNASLNVGNLIIPISAYTKVTEYKPKSWKTAYAHKPATKIDRRVDFILNDENQTKVIRENIIPAFKYGTTLVPYTDEDKMNMEYLPGEKGMKVLGFTKALNVKRCFYSGDKSMYIFGQKSRELSGVLLAPFIQALFDTKMVAIVRYVYSSKSQPKIGFLSPKIKTDYECLVLIFLPYVDDLRHFMFTPFDANSPTDEELAAVDSLITLMDLTTPENKDDFFNPKHTVNPFLQRLYQCLQHKVFYPEKPLPEILSHIKSLLMPPPGLLDKAEPALKNIKSVFSFKDYFTKKLSESNNSSFSNGSSNTNSIESNKNGIEEFEKDGKFVALDTVTDRISQVCSVNPIRDFQYLLSSGKLSFREACLQMVDVVFRYLQNSGSLKLYHTKILSICKEFRRASLKENDATEYNSFMKTLQGKLLECDEELWSKIRTEKIDLIRKSELESSSICGDEAEAYLSVASSHGKDSVKTEIPCGVDDDYDNLMDEL